MALEEIIIMIAPSLAGTSAVTLISIIVGSFLKKLLKKKVDEVSENAEFEKVHKELAEIKEVLNKIRGKAL